MFWVHGLGELGAGNLAPGVLVPARYRINGDRADVDGAEDVVNGPSDHGGAFNLSTKPPAPKN